MAAWLPGGGPLSDHESPVTLGIGRVLYGMGMVAFGVENLIYADGVLHLEPLPAWGAGHVGLAYLTGLVLIVCGAGLFVGRGVRLAAMTLSAMLGAWVVLLHLPALVVHPQDGWTATSETLALCSAALVLSGPATMEGYGETAPRSLGLSAVGVARLGRVCFGLSLPIFGLLHFIFHDYVSSVTPAWIPGHLAWAYGIGVAFIAAGLSILTGVQARLAASLLGVMFGTWVLNLHGPRVVAAPHNRAEWTSLIVAMAMSGGS